MVLEVKKENQVTPVSLALLIQAIFWLGLALSAQIVLGLPFVTLSMLLIGIFEVLFRYSCIRLAIRQGVKFYKVYQIFSDEYLRNVETYKKLLLYLATQGLVFFFGVSITIISAFISGDSLVLIGALLCIMSFLKMIPVYPLEGGILFLQSSNQLSPGTRVMFESLGFLIMGVSVAYLGSMSVAAFFLIPALMLPLRVQSLLTRYALILRCEDYVREHGEEVELTDQELVLQVRRSPEIRGLERVYNDEERESFIKAVVREVCLRPFYDHQRALVRRVYFALLLLQVVVLISSSGYYFGVGREAVERPLMISDCFVAKQRLKSYRILLEITGDFDMLRDAVITCHHKQQNSL